MPCSSAQQRNRPRDRAGNNSYTYPIWDEAVGKIPWNFLDPMVEDFPIIGRDTRLVALGCCFVQRMAAFLKAAKYNLHVSEAPPEGEALLSARYGNVNSARQALQLFRRAYGELEVPDVAGIWTRKEDGLLIDALRPAVADPFASAGEVKRDRAAHLAAVRDALENAEVLLYSAGQTECWMSRSTGVVYPVAPGMLNRDFDVGDLVFKNFTVSEVVADFGELLSRLRGVNPDVKVIFTVSPLSIIATFEGGQHALTANCYSKSALRAAAHEICRARPDVHYFPAFEAIAGLHTAGCLYESNMRTVTDAGLDMAMRIFVRHFAVGGRDERAISYVSQDAYDGVLCDPPPLSAGL